MSVHVYLDELWIAIPGYEGFYSVNNLGQVRRDFANNGCKVKILKPQGPPGGYLHVTLCKNGTKTIIRVHRLVLEAFYGIDPERPHSNHKNGIRGDNRLINLEWCTVGENIRHAYNVLKRRVVTGDYGCHAKLNSEQVKQIRVLLSQGTIYRVIAKQFGVSRTAISDIVTGRTWSYVKDAGPDISPAPL